MVLSSLPETIILSLNLHKQVFGDKEEKGNKKNKNKKKDNKNNLKYSSDEDNL